ncbi:DUF885 family protein [Actinomadura litoris]|uniref:DUF885 family protein n=1 Tax=Actinomadura litoris TaxID=2678616 RepID=A0A7K1L840_9ACTN|nr:DUF885 family protein [Actinomadura litoris]MUN40579.1 DUF885 family protein [Actinomadura litoris]
MDALTGLGLEIWAWRAARRPQTGDDIDRLERPAGWVPDFSAAAMEASLDALAGFERRRRGLRDGDAPVPAQVDWYLLGSVLARARWELERYPLWRTNPRFYVDQSVGVLFEALLAPPPFGEGRAADLVAKAASIPRTLEHARANLDAPAAELADFTIRQLDPIGGQFAEVAEHLVPLLPAPHADRMRGALTDAAAALGDYREWLRTRRPSMGPYRSPGPDAARHFLGAVALTPFTPEEMVAVSRLEAERARWLELVERNRGGEDPPVLPDRSTQIAREADAHRRLTRFLDEQGLLSPAGDVGRYLFAPMPGYLAPLQHLGVPHDVTGPSRPSANAFRYIEEPGPALGGYDRLQAIDPMVALFHEGVHADQLARSWHHPDPLRRFFYDSGPVEGIAFYHEELVLRAGLFDADPFLRRTALDMMAIRAQRVEADVRLAVGEFTLPEVEVWQRERFGSFEAEGEVEQVEGSAADLAETPLRALTYQIGKTQLLRLINDAHRRQGDAFALRTVHDRLWSNGNVPLSLLRWELLGDRTELDTAEAMG